MSGNGDYISREAAFEECDWYANEFSECEYAIMPLKGALEILPAADVRPVVTCSDCKHNNACLTQAFVEEASRVPFDRNTFFCADGKRADEQNPLLPPLRR